MTLITTVTYRLEHEVDDDYFKEQLEEGLTKEEAMLDTEKFIYDEVIDNIEGRIENSGYLSEWSRESIDMSWED